MKPEVKFLRDTAERLKQRRYSHWDNDLSMVEWKETIICQVEFLIAADEIEGIHKTPQVERVIIPKAPAPQREVAAFAEPKFPPQEEAIIAVPRVPRRVEPLRVEQRKEVLILKDLPRKNTLILKDLNNIESANVAQVEENKPQREEIPKSLKIKKEVIRRPDRAPQVEREQEVSLIRLVKLQRGRCAYCFRRFGDRVFSKRKIVTLHATREHFIPESIGGKIIFAACQMCNFFKRDYLFKSISACRKYLAEAWGRSGHKDTNGHFLADVQQFSKN